MARKLQYLIIFSKMSHALKDKLLVDINHVNRMFLQHEVDSVAVV